MLSFLRSRVDDFEQGQHERIYLLSDQKRGVVTSCKCVGWGGADHQLAAISLDRMQR